MRADSSVEMGGDVDAFETITCAVAGPVATVTLNRPEARNAMSQAMVEELLRCFTVLREDAYRDVRVAILRAAGETFCAGGDLRDMSAASEEGASIGARLDKLLRAVNEAPQVVVARIQGAAMGGGLGLVCVSDIAIADEGATFGLPEVRLGLAPAVISPYVIQRIGFTRARQLTLTGRRFGAVAALEYGLVSEIAPAGQLDAQVEATVADVLKCAPNALRECKRLLFTVLTQPDALEERVATLDRLRMSEEAAEGIMAFLQKKSAPWVPDA
jgi:enoyl-CoA hydratase/carnithine racemase